MPDVLRYEVVRTGDPQVSVLVRDQARNTDIALTLFALKAVDSLGLAPGTGRGYLYQLLGFCSWAESDRIAAREGWTRHGPPQNVQALIDRYLRHVGRCDLTYKKDRHGFDACFIRLTAASKVQIAPLLAALRAYYALLINKGSYGFENPMECRGARLARERIRQGEAEAFAQWSGRLRMPRSSGIDAPSDRELPSTAYFRPVNNDWRPNIKADPQLSAKVLKAGEGHGWTLQQHAVARLLFRTGARIDEVCSMTLLGWWESSGFRRTAFVHNKGSRKIATKEVVLDKTSQKFLRDYINLERVKLDPMGRTLAIFERLALRGELDPDEPIFITRRGTPLTAQHFRDYYWRSAMTRELEGITPHAARHNMVTLHLAEIDRIARTPKERDRLREDFAARMSWASGEAMLKVYDRRTPGQKILGVMQKVHARMSRRERELATRPDAPAEPPVTLGHESTGLLAQLIGEEDA